MRVGQRLILLHYLVPPPFILELEPLCFSWQRGYPLRLSRFHLLLMIGMAVCLGLGQLYMNRSEICSFWIGFLMMLVLDFICPFSFPPTDWKAATGMARTALNSKRSPVLGYQPWMTLWRKLSTICPPPSHLCISVLFHERKYLFFFFLV